MQNPFGARDLFFACRLVVGAVLLFAPRGTPNRGLAEVAEHAVMPWRACSTFTAGDVHGMGDCSLKA